MAAGPAAYAEEAAAAEVVVVGTRDAVVVEADVFAAEAVAEEEVVA